MKILFKIIAKLNKWVLPSYKNKDLLNLSKFDKLVIGFRYYITKNAL